MSRKCYWPMLQVIIFSRGSNVYIIMLSKGEYSTNGKISRFHGNSNLQIIVITITLMVSCFLARYQVLYRKLLILTFHLLPWQVVTHMTPAYLSLGPAEKTLKPDIIVHVWYAFRSQLFLYLYFLSSNVMNYVIIISYLYDVSRSYLAMTSFFSQCYTKRILFILSKF